MTADPNFQPIFGPNGAVMNAPTMTPEMRAKFDEAGKIPPRANILRSFRLFALSGFLFLLSCGSWSGGLAHDR